MAEASSPIRVRLAPSPTGTLHIGTARTAVFNWLFARHHGGSFLLRIEDTDRERSKAEYTDNILDGLRWLGLNWDGEPVIQSERIESHRQAIARLLAEGKAYRCYTSEAELTALREQQQAQKQAPRYDNRHRQLTPAQEQAFIAEGREAVVRFRIDDDRVIEWHDLVRGAMRWSGADLGGDMVIARRAPADAIGDPLYNLVVVVDDAAMAISHVIRGEDHIANTAKQLLLYEALGLPLPIFAHTPLILNQEGRKLSKRDGVTSISDFRGLGYTPEALTNYMTLLGWSPPEGMGERFTLAEAATVFGFDRVNRAGARFDWEKLNWLNGQVLHALPPGELLQQLQPLWAAKGWPAPDLAAALPPGWLEELCSLLGTSLTLLKDGVDQAAPFFTAPLPDEQARAVLAQPDAQACLAALGTQLPNGPSLPTPEAQALLTAAATSAGVKKGVVMKSLRAALLGSLKGPDLLASWQLLHQIGEDRRRLMINVF
ncbi:MAG: glutamate--tRNA ligase [Cyanobacteria bacterium K_Offshore_surface_m2_239]|nr:glutamate--tRNA ligase [Cyanobacteria bacterium K_Offshore_surface_m2_239]